VFGTLGALIGGGLSDRLASRLKGGPATVLCLMVLVCVPLMIGALFATSGTPFFYVGLCAGFFLPLATYGPALALVQSLAPGHMHATATGVTMMSINILAIAIGNLAAGMLSDSLRATGYSQPLTIVLLVINLIIGLSLFIFWRVSRSGDARLRAERDTSLVAH
jgi:MFS family permease